MKIRIVKWGDDEYRIQMKELFWPFWRCILSIYETLEEAEFDANFLNKLGENKKIEVIKNI